VRPDLIDEARAALTRSADEGRIHPVVDHVVPFADAPRALTALASGTTVGRVVISVST
jgi:NADPH2:quinone reductase